MEFYYLYWIPPTTFKKDKVNIVLDLGAAPGSWSQIVSKIVAPKHGLVVSVDLLPMKAQYDACTFKSNIYDLNPFLNCIFLLLKLLGAYN